MANNIKRQLFSGVFYTALAKYSGIIISLVVAGILARLLSPDDFGIVAIATVIIAFFNLFTDMGISPAIIQHKALTKEELSDIFSFTVWTGIAISLLFFAASWLIADYYDSQILRILCLRHHRARSHVLSQQRIQIHRCPQFHYPDSRRCGSGYGSPLRSRTLRTDYHPDHLQHTDICHFLPALSATIALHMGIDSTPQDLFIFGLSIPVQRHQLFQS